MDRVINLAEVVQREVADYANVQSWKAAKHYCQDDQHRIYSVIVVPELPRPFPARIIGDRVVIDEDTTDRPLVEELMRSGIPREQIVLAYAGETLPEEDDA